MAKCSRCGNEVLFRYINGRYIPLHPSGGCIDSGATSIGKDYSGYTRSEESCCFLTSCPQCRGSVFFIRFNGGSVWIDPPLGPPWFKHSCMDDSEKNSGEDRAPLVNWILGENEKSSQQILGVIKEAEVSPSKKFTITRFDTEKNDRYILIIKNNAGFLTGKLVIFNPIQKTIAPLENTAFIFSTLDLIDGPLQFKSESPLTRCPECETPINSKNLKKHLKNQHDIGHIINSHRT